MDDEVQKPTGAQTLSGDVETPPAPAEAQETPAQEPEAPQTLQQILDANPALQAEYQTLLETHTAQQRQTWEAQAQAQEDQIRIDLAQEAALERYGARNGKAVAALLNRDKIRVEEGKVTGLTEQLDALLQSDPYLFRENGGRPYFSGPTGGGSAPGSAEADRIAARYRNNPFYHGRR